VKEIDLRPIGRGAAAGKVGPITAKLKKDYQAIVRGELALDVGKNWLTPIK
jgi:hypothetical protein